MFQGNIAVPNLWGVDWDINNRVPDVMLQEFSEIGEGLYSFKIRRLRLNTLHLKGVGGFDSVA
jgi:hypothetical protein